MIPYATQTAAGPDADAGLQARLDHLFRKQVQDGHDGWAALRLRRHVEAYRLQQDGPAPGDQA